MLKLKVNPLSLQASTWAKMLCFLLCLLLSTTATTQSNPSHAPYTPTDFILLNCGASSDATSLDGRRWNGDTNSEFLTSNSKPASSSFTASTQDPSVSPVPFMTARIIYSHFTYTFPALPGPKFIRFYFYPATYSNLDTSNSFFSLVANNYRLLHNFSASLAASASKPRVATFFSEFIITVRDDQILNLTFSPSPNSFAFINGIEVVSIPNNLYAHGNDIPIPFVGFDYPFYLDNGTALQTVQRLNVGGLDIKGVDDSGMYRTWNRDQDFLLGAQVGITPIPSDDLTIKYTKKTPPYTAPESVYSTFRFMGTDPTANLKYNLTWLFPVDGGFNYLVRLHICESRTEVRTPNQLVFNIFINHQLAEEGVDVFYLSGASGVPVYKDYTMWVPEGRIHGSQDLRLELHPYLAQQTEYHDALLNGVEIFKLNKTDGNLAGPNPEVIKAPPPETGQNPPIKSRARSRGLLHVIVVLGLVIGSVCALSFVVCSFILQQKRTAKVSTNKRWIVSSNGKKDENKSSSINLTLLLPSHLCREFSFLEIELATNKFHKDNVIGIGGFGNVYKGHIDGGAVLVAIKRLHSSSNQGAREFETEIMFLSKLRHGNLVSLVGYCSDHGEMILVYEYLHRGTLCDHLYKTQNPHLQWKQRLQICIGAAKGLEYLHTGTEHPIIHRDIKSTNILLDQNWEAKISDFGLTRLGPINQSQTHVTTLVKGTFGYLDPEYFRRLQLTEKSDVYSFGVVLWEVLCARPVASHPTGEKPVSLVELARKNYKKGTVDKIIDRYLVGKISPDSLNKFVEMAISCLQENGTDRPPMTEVVCFLELALKSQESAEQTTASDEETPLKWSSVGEPEDSDMFSSSDGIAVNSRISGFSNVTSNSHEQSYATIDSAEMLAGAVFSEILKPKGR